MTANNSSNLSSDFHVLLVGYLYPEWLEPKLLNQPILPVQTQRFGQALLDALREGFNDCIEVLSVAPLLDFPHSRLLVAPSAKWTIDNKIPATMVPFVNLFGLKHLTRFVLTLVYVLFWVCRNRSYHRVIILHGVQSCKIFGVILGQFLAPSIIIPFLTDDIGIPLKWESVFVKLLRHFDVYLMKFDLQKVTGVISMTSQLAQKLAPERPNLIIPTIQNLRMSLPLRNSTKSKKNTFNILYCGGLFHKYGVDLLLDAFIQADRPNWQLFITGKGDLETKIRNIAERNSQIQYFGFINIEKLVELYQIADVFVNPRLTTTPFSNLSFPSKVVEYLGTGKPVISTNLQIFDEKLKQHLIIARTDKPEELIRCFNEVASRDDQQREAWRLETIEFLANELSPVIQGRRIREFVASLTILN